MEEGEAIEHGMVSQAIERAQKQVEGRNFETRKHLLEYDDVMNKQREAIYKLRRDILEGREGRDYVMKSRRDILDDLLEAHCAEKTDPQEWDLTGLRTEMLAYFNINAGELEPRRARHRRAARDPVERRSRRGTTRRSRGTSPRSCAASSGPSCSTSSTRPGRTTSSPSTT